jgi:5-oxoprolinase (ATP-hydrolysing) subunit A
MKIDLNCDMGESFGHYTLGSDEAIMPFISSANIACGYHAGDPLVMMRTVTLAAKHNVGVGAHPGYPDLQGFGRRSLELSAEEIEAMVLYQVSALAGFAKAASTELVHVKPHGALYNQAATDNPIARAVARGVAKFSKNLILVGLAGSALVAAGVVEGLRVANEAFPDRAYNFDGTLMPRQQPGAVFENVELVVNNAARLATQGISSGNMQVKVDTLCLHGDNPIAPALAKAVWTALAERGIDVMGLAKVL